MAKYVGNAPASIYTGIPGWETEAEEKELVELAKRVLDNGIIVELGGEYGRSAAEFAFAVNGRNITIWTIDRFPSPYQNLSVGLKTIIQHNLRVAGFSANTKQIQGESAEVGKTWDNGLIDLLFVDADHSYEGVKADIEAWEKHIKPGGLIVFHDCAKEGKECHPVHYEVKKAVDEWAARSHWERHDAPDSLVWFVKPSIEPTLETVIEHLKPITLREAYDLGVLGLRALGKTRGIEGLDKYKNPKLLIRRLQNEGVILTGE